LRGLRGVYCMHTLTGSQKACNDGPNNETSKLQFSSISSFFRRLAGAEISRNLLLTGTQPRKRMERSNNTYGQEICTSSGEILVRSDDAG